MTNTAENLILDRFSDEELEKADLGRLRMLAKELREQRDENDRARASNAEVITDYRRQQEKLADALMVILGDPIEALIESKIEYSSRSFLEDLVDTAMQDFDIDDHRCAIDDMIDERLSERLGDIESDDDRHAAVEEIVKDVISGASISIDI
jgi:membrane carboxypeptidase/penicillin-binding protein PbpC